MKYPQLVSMPSAVSNWLEEQLEARGLDASVYARYILSLLHSDAVDVICSDDDLHFSHLKKELKRSGGGRKRLRRSSDWWSDALANAEKLKRSAAIECLMSASEQTSSFESLIDELCEKLKQVDAPSTDQPLLRKPKQDNQQLSFQELANRYYAAFPPLDRKNSLCHQQATKWSTTSKMDSNRNNSNMQSNPSREDGIPDLPIRISLEDRMDVGVILGRYQHSNEDLPSTLDSFHGSSSDSGSVSSRDHEELCNLAGVGVALPASDNRFARHRNWGEEYQRRYTETYDGEAYEVYDHRYSPIKNKSGEALQEDLGRAGISDETCEAYDNRYSAENNREVYEAYDHRYSNTKKENLEEQTFMERAIREMQSQPARRNLGVVGGPVPEICFSCNKIHGDEPSTEDQITCQISLMRINHNPQTSAFVKTKPKVRRCLFPPKETTLTFTQVMSTIRDTPLRTIERSDDLLTSTNTHFCPIKTGVPVVYRGDYPDGATFTVNNNLDKVDYTRSESGFMYVESGRKYRELGRTRNLSTFWDYKNLVLKFEVNNNDKSCQTEKVQYEIGYLNQLKATEQFKNGEPDENTAMNTDYSTDESSKDDPGDGSPLSPLSEVLQELPWKPEQCCPDHDVCGHLEEIWKANEVSEWPQWNVWPSKEKETGSENAGDIAPEELKGDVEEDGEQLLSDLEAHLRNFATETESPDTEDSGWCEEPVDLMESQRSLTLDYKDSLVWLLHAPLTPNQPSSNTEEKASTWDVPESQAVTF